MTANVDGKTDAGGDGILALTEAQATANNTHQATQANDNTATATTTGSGAFIAQGPINLNLVGSTNDLNCPGCGQTATQTNSHQAELEAELIAYTGDVNVDSTGYTTADGGGINAQAHATANATATSSLVGPNNTPGQSNKNSMTGTTAGGPAFVVVPAFIVQGQTTNQQNTNSEEISAGVFAFSGDVTVNRDGNTDADGFGINALAGAGGTATVDSDVSQSNDNSATATTNGTGAAVAQAPFSIAGILTANGGQSVTQLTATNNRSRLSP